MHIAARKQNNARFAAAVVGVVASAVLAVPMGPLGVALREPGEPEKYTNKGNTSTRSTRGTDVVRRIDV